MRPQHDKNESEREWSYLKNSDCFLSVPPEIKNRELLKTHPGIEKTWRHASLNCYDFDRLLEEFSGLTEMIGHKELEVLAPTLCLIIRESSVNCDYPGRHRPFGDVTGRSTWRYQCLRIMDEVLSTAEEKKFFTDSQMDQKIRTKCTEYGIEYHKIEYNKAGSTIFRKLYAILNELISVEHFTGGTVQRSRDVYKKGAHGYCYNTYKGDRKLSAFAVDITVDEAYKLRSEVRNIRACHFNDDRNSFAERYPLISVLGYIEELSFKKNNPDPLINKGYDTDMVTVNYRTEEFGQLKKKIANAISHQIPLPVKTPDSWEIFRPIELKSEGRKWVVVAKCVATSELRVITPQELVPTFESYPHLEQQSDKGAPLPEEAPSSVPMIGLRPLIRNKAYEISLSLTSDGMEVVARAKSLLSPLKPSFKYNRLFGVASFTSNEDQFAEAGVASFTSYVNEDLLDEILRLDRTAKLVSIAPDEIRDIYEDYFVKQMGYRRTPLKERSGKTKRLPRPKKNQSE